MSAIPKPPPPGSSHYAVAALRQRLLQVIAQHQRGELASAIAGYREVLAVNPRQFDALRLLAVALLARGQADEALVMLDRALSVRADFAEVWFVRGDALAQLDRASDAAQSLEHALSLQPDRPAAWVLLGTQRHALSQFTAALEAFDRALSIAPQNAAAWCGRALALDALHRPSEALAHYERALELDPRAEYAWCNRAKVLSDLGRFEEALSSLDRGLELAPAMAVLWSSRSTPLRALGRLEEALTAGERALALDPSSPGAYAQHGATLAQLGRYEEAQASMDRALQIDPGDRLARFNRGILDLTLGRFTSGWQGYEARERANAMDLLLSSVPAWDGQPLQGKTVGLVCEQGLGDTIQFCRYAAVLVQHGARVLLTVPAVLHRLLGSLGEGVRVMTDGDALPAMDYQCLLMSVPYYLGTTIETIPAQVPYLHAPASLLRRWQESLGLGSTTADRRSRLRVGLVCSGNPGQFNDRHRSIALQRFAELQALDCEWHLLQKDIRVSDEPWLQRLGVIDHRAELNDFCETAALIGCMDAVVSVDTSVAHLAGAMGVPLYLLLPANADWRWLLEREDCPWYPSARLLRQRQLGDWDEPIARLRAALQAIEQTRQPDQQPSTAPRLAPPGGDAEATDWREDAMLAQLLQATRAAPQDATAQFRLGLRYLTLGCFDAGWDCYEWRQRVPGLTTAMPEGGVFWDGSQELAGRSLLLCHEQGLGDVIQFSRFVPLLAARGARVLLGVPAPLAGLMQSLPGVGQVIGGDDPVPAFDLKCLLLSVGQRLGTTLQTIPAQIPYLAPAHERLLAWREKIGPAGGAGAPLRVGVACSGNRRHPADAVRSIALRRFAALRQAGCELHLLQDELRPSDEGALAELSIRDHRGCLHDFGETAALACCMDAIVSVDTSVAHLAGALGIPLLLLLPAEADWRWMLARGDSPWYPSARLLRQSVAGDWEQPLQQAVLALRAIARASAAPEAAPGPRGVAGQASPLVVADRHPVSPLRRSTVTPVDIPAILAAAIAKHREGGRADAIPAYRAILQYDPKHFDAQRLLGAALLQEERFAESLVALDQALALREDCEQAWSLRAGALTRLGRIEEALQSTERSLALAPEKADIWTNHGRLLQSLGRMESALGSFDRAVALAPDRPHFRVNRAIAHLIMGNFGPGWEQFESRLQVPELCMLPVVDRPLWDGRAALAGKTVLVACEQGLGDTIQFCRFVPLLAALGARVVLGVQAPLQLLLQSLPGNIEVLAEGQSLPQIDLQCWLLSLPHRLGTTVASIPSSVPYLHPPAARIEHWRDRLRQCAHLQQDTAVGAVRRRMGLACSGSASYGNDGNRSLPLEILAPFLPPDCEWHLLQTQLRPQDEPWITRLGIIDHREELRDFCDTAALASCMDAVVSVDTALAHLTGALGVPLHLLLSADPDWRWLRGREDSPWYPSARLYRQQRLGGWEQPLRQLQQALQAGS